MIPSIMTPSGKKYIQYLLKKSIKIRKQAIENLAMALVGRKIIFIKASEDLDISLNMSDFRNFAKSLENEKEPCENLKSAFARFKKESK